MQVELLEAKTETFGPLGGGGRGDECRHLARHGSGLRPAAGLRRLGHGPLLVLRHDLRPARRAAAGKASGTEARDLGPSACWWRSKPTWRQSPWEGEGYRKVWARLRVCRDIRVARKRVLRLMRENNLLSPHRCRRRGGNPHDGEIITHAPNLMWGTDGVRVFTVDDGWGWIFTAVEHWNAECVGWHVCKRGDRFAALQPISMGLAGLYGSTAAGAARGLALRMDHGSQYLSDHFTNQIKFWGIQPSYAFVAEPQTNGVAERFNRTLKEQIIHGRIYRNIAELRDAVRDFVELYNAQWIVEKNGYLSPAQARQGVARRDLNQARPRETKLVSKEPGALHPKTSICCATS